MITVFNVGQGDSFLLQPEDCIFETVPLLIDCGPRRARVHTKLMPEKVNIMITHSHSDHIGGLNSKLIKMAERIYVPFYLPEIDQIERYLKKRLKHSSMKAINYKAIWSKVILVYEGSDICCHGRILNPPENPFVIFNTFIHSTKYDGDNFRVFDIKSAIEFLIEKGIELPTKEIVEYNTPLRTHSEINSSYNIQARTFVHEFFIHLANRIQHTNAFELHEIDFIVNSHFKLTANQVSVVLMYQDSKTQTKALFTGDADISVFERLISKGTSISAEILKVPHHGSRENINKRVLDFINPKIALVSHNNRKFGMSKDAHPHNEVIDVLDNNGVDTYYTNEVIKGGMILRPKTSGLVFSNNIEFV